MNTDFLKGKKILIAEDDFVNQKLITHSLTVTGASFDIAGNIHSNLKIYEVVVFKNILLNTLQRQKVEGYLAWKWSLQTSLPATHPYAKFPPLP